MKEPRRIELWDTVPEPTHGVPYLVYYEPEVRHTTGALLLVPGSGYAHSPARPTQEGDRIARALTAQGVPVFLLIYRVLPDQYPAPLLDGRRAMRLIRHRAAEFGIAGGPIATLGFSAGGHLCATLAAYHAPLDGEGADEVDAESYRPDLQALCYPVISFDVTKPYTHAGSVYSLLGDAPSEELVRALDLTVSTEAPIPPTFFFHNFDDRGVGVENSLLYAAHLHTLGTSVEVHIYPDGGHGVGLSVADTPVARHDNDWFRELVRWLTYQGFLGSVGAVK